MRHPNFSFRCKALREALDGPREKLLLGGAHPDIFVRLLRGGREGRGGGGGVGGIETHLKEMRKRIARAFCPCWLFVTCSTCLRLLPLLGCRLLPFAGSSLSCMNFGTAACNAPRSQVKVHTKIMNFGTAACNAPRSQVKVHTKIMNFGTAACNAPRSEVKYTQRSHSDC